MSDLQGIAFTVSGKVQGVWFRSATEKQAKKLGLTGWVQNCDNGEVEGHAFGSEEQLKAFETWLHKGPPLAKVTSVVTDNISVEEYSDFCVRKECF
jgi:acylphosphatase